MTHLPAESSSHPLADLASIRRRFPALERTVGGTRAAYFDGPGGTQVPTSVVDAVADYLLNHNANTHWPYPTSEETDAILAAARSTVAEFFNAEADEVAFGANMTTLTFHLARALGRAWGPGDEVIVTELDHHANVAPWTALVQDRGVTVRTVPLDPATGQLDLTVLEALVSPRTRLLAVGAASNALGTITDVAHAAALIHAAGGLCFVDAVHYAPHALVDVRRLGCDFLACSAYKFYGPHVGVLFGRPELVRRLEVPKLAPAPDHAPERLETGTLNHEGIAGTAAAVEFLASLAPGATLRERLARAYRELHRRGQQLVERLWRGLDRIPGVRLYGPPPGAPRTPTVAFALSGRPSAEVARALGREGVFVTCGDFYASTVAERLGMAADGLLRAGCACYTTEEEVDRLLAGIDRLAR
jgi:cysteine desulfurase family protein (TIGR01976 family)